MLISLCNSMSSMRLWFSKSCCSRSVLDTYTYKFRSLLSFSFHHRSFRLSSFQRCSCTNLLFLLWLPSCCYRISLHVSLFLSFLPSFLFEHCFPYIGLHQRLNSVVALLASAASIIHHNSQVKRKSESTRSPAWSSTTMYFPSGPELVETVTKRSHVIILVIAHMRHITKQL